MQQVAGPNSVKGPGPPSRFNRLVIIISLDFLYQLVEIALVITTLTILPTWMEESGHKASTIKAIRVGLVLFILLDVVTLIVYTAILHESFSISSGKYLLKMYNKSQQLTFFVVMTIMCFAVTFGVTISLYLDSQSFTDKFPRQFSLAALVVYAIHLAYAFVAFFVLNGHYNDEKKRQQDRGIPLMHQKYPANPRLGVPTIPILP